MRYYRPATTEQDNASPPPRISRPIGSRIVSLTVFSLSTASFAFLGFAALTPTRASASTTCAKASQVASGSQSTILSVTAGRSLNVGTPSGYGNGHWKADYGTFDTDGTYIAPDFIPAHGVDLLRYVTSVDVVTAIVHISAPPEGAPAQTRIPFNIAPHGSPLWDDPAYLASLHQAFDGQPADAVAAPTDYVEAPIEVADCIDAEDTVQGLELGAHNESGQPVVIETGIEEVETETGTQKNAEPQAMRSPTWPIHIFLPRPTRCIVKPGHQPPPGYCSGPASVQGKITVDPPKDSTEPGSSITVTVDAGNKDSLIAAFPGFGLQIGATYTLPVTNYVTSWTCHMTVDYWKCVNGTWVFDHSEMCRQSKIERSLPDWALHPLRLAPDPPSRPWQPSFPSCCGRI